MSENGHNGIKIDKSVPIPKHADRNGKYPWREMEIGDSFVVSSAGDKLPSAASWAGKRHGLRFTCRKIDENTTRVWRIA